jgi:hypothetical protein
MILVACPAYAQEKRAWGSLSGTVIDKKTKKPVGDAIIFLKVAKGKLSIHPDDKKQKDLAIQVPPGRDFEIRTFAYFPHYLEGEKKVPTGQKLNLIGDAQQDHVFQFRALHKLATDEDESHMLKRMFDIGRPETVSTYLVAGERNVVDLRFLTGYEMQSQTYHELKAFVFVFDHPCFAISKKDGSFIIPRAPADTQLVVCGWHETYGNILGKSGKAVTLKDGKNTIDVSAQPED